MECRACGAIMKQEIELDSCDSFVQPHRIAANHLRDTHSFCLAPSLCIDSQLKHRGGIRLEMGDTFKTTGNLPHFSGFYAEWRFRRVRITFGDRPEPVQVDRVYAT